MRKQVSTKRAWKSFWSVVKEADVVLEILDARFPDRFRYKNIEEKLKRMGKAIILVINKADLIPKEVLNAWKRIFSKEYPTVYLSATERLGTRILRKTILRYAPRIPAKVAIVGYPNVGKSSIINVLKGRHSAGTSPIPGFTTSIQLIRISSKIMMIDTPGVFPSLGKEEELALKGALRPESLENPYFAAKYIFETILNWNPMAIKETYDINTTNFEEFIEEFARKRGLLKKKGELNIDEACRIFIRDWQKGKIMAYEKPDNIS
ncbi:MAG: GTPase [Candidatus Asgardarchaeia archaeon]